MSYVTLPSVSVLCSSHRPALTLARCSVAAHCASLRVLATPALRASDVRSSLAHWAYYGLFPPQAAAFVRPPPVSAKILRIFGRGNCKETIFALENEIFHRKNRSVPAVHAAGYDCTAKGLPPSRLSPGFFDSLRAEFTHVSFSPFFCTPNICRSIGANLPKRRSPCSTAKCCSDLRQTG